MSLVFWPFSSFDQFEYPKYLVFLGSTLVVVTVQFLCGSLINLSLVPKKVWMWVGMLFVGNILALFFSVDRGVSFTGALFRYQGFLTQVFYLLFFFCSFVFFRSTSKVLQQHTIQFLLFLLGIVSLCAVIPFFGIFPLFDPVRFEHRIFGTLGNPNYLASFLITIFPFFLFSFQKKIGVLFLGSTLFLGVLFFTGSRSGLLALLVTALFFFFFTAKHKKVSVHQWLAVLGIILCLVIVFFLSPYLRQRFSFESKNYTSVFTRLDIWQAGLHVYTRHPFTGVGQDTLALTISPFLPDRVRLNIDFYVDRLHSEPLDILVMTGPLTLVGYYGLFLFLWLKGWRMLKQNSHVVMGPVLFSLLSLGLYHLVNFSTITSNVFWYFSLGFLCAEVASPNIHSLFGGNKKT